MNRTARDKRRYVPKPVKRIELDEPHPLRRLTAVGLALAVAVSALWFAIGKLLSPEAGWQTITYGGTEISADASFTLNYELGRADMNLTAERKQVTLIYSDALENAWHYFSADAEALPGEANLRSLNTAPGEEFLLAKPLYEVLEYLERQGSRSLYMGPIYEQYDSLFASDNDIEAAAMDPLLDEDAAAFTKEAALFAQDPDSVRLELLGNDRAVLRVSEEYRRWAQDNGVTKYLDLFYLQDAFSVDYIAACLSNRGFVNGIITAADGSCRVLDGAESFRMGIYAPEGDGCRTAAILNLPSPRSVVSLRTFTSPEAERFYRYTDGAVRFPALNDDGICQARCDALTYLSSSVGCGELMLQLHRDLIGMDSKDSAWEAEMISVTGSHIQLSSEDLCLVDFADDCEIEYGA